ncbi:MAG: ArsR family transcriptional regulator [Candidatus Aenigmarchaeota archaeon]|nr:ArsR family transcriptional regulator [Candidatus Aenigmarchaeota archaeon]
MELTIRSLKPPTRANLDEDLEWFCKSLGLVNRRDKHKTCFKVFRLIIDYSKKGEEISANEIARQIGITRTAVIHHLRTLKDAGIVINEGTTYELRMRSLQKIVDEIKMDLERTLAHVREIAEDIDKMLEMPVRPKVK